MTAPSTSAIEMDSAAVSGSVQRLVLSDSVTIYHGDCLEVLPHISGAIVTDPPYGTGETGRDEAGAIQETRQAWDKWQPEWIGDHERVAMFIPPAELLRGNWDGWRLMSWNSENPMKRKNVAPRYGIQPILARGRFPDRATLDWKKHRNNIATPDHPHQKPLPIMAWLVDVVTDEGETVIDPFMGSGTTAIACHRTGRRFIGIERDPDHFETARKRIEAELAQGDLF